MLFADDFSDVSSANVYRRLLLPVSSYERPSDWTCRYHTKRRRVRVISGPIIINLPLPAVQFPSKVTPDPIFVFHRPGARRSFLVASSSFARTAFGERCATIKRLQGTEQRQCIFRAAIIASVVNAVPPLWRGETKQSLVVRNSRNSH